MQEDVEHFQLVSGRQLDPAEVPKLELKLRDDPTDLHSRLQLVTYYQWAPSTEDAEAFSHHLNWIIANKPEIDFKHYNIWVGARHIVEAEASWIQAIERDPNNVVILRNAIECCRLLSKGAVREFLERGYKLDPLNEEWPRELSFLYYLRTLDVTVEQGKDDAIKSVQFGKEAFELYKQYPKKGYFQDNLCGTAERLAEICFRFGLFDDAQYFGQYLVEHGQERLKTGDKERLRNHAREVHMGHSILGRTALQKNDVEMVLTHLSKMPLLLDIDFEHDLLFARALLERGRTSSVCAYLDDCISNYSKMLEHMVEGDPFYQAILQDRDMPCDGPGYLLDNLRETISRLVEWKTAIRDGQKVDLPEHI